MRPSVVARASRPVSTPPSADVALRLSTPLILLSEYFPPAVGGSPVLFDEVYSRLEGAPVTVVTDSVSSASPATEHRGLHVVREAIATRQWGLRQGGLRHHVRLARRLHALATDPRTIVHCGRALPEGIAAWISRLMGGPRYICWCHGEDVGTALTSREQTFVMKRVYRGAAAVFANSRNTRQMLMDIGVAPDRIHVVYPGVDANRFSPGVDGARIRDRFATGETLLLSVGRLQRRKGHDHVIDTLASMRDGLPRLCYVILGDGEERPRLEHLVEAHGLTDRVIFAGRVSNDDLPAYYAACDIFLMPNRVDGGDLEGFGIVFLEAAAMGKPAIGGASGGAPEAVESDVTGLLVSGTDRAELAAAIVRLARSPRLRAQLGAAGRVRVLAGFTWDRAAAAVAAVHERVGKTNR